MEAKDGRVAEHPDEDDGRVVVVGLEANLGRAHQQRHRRRPLLEVRVAHHLKKEQEEEGGG